MKKIEKVEITVGEIDFKFELTPEVYTAYINEIMPDDKVAPAYNLVYGSVAKTQLDDLKEIVTTPAVMSICGMLAKKYQDQVQVTLKK